MPETEENATDAETTETVEGQAPDTTDDAETTDTTADTGKPDTVGGIAFEDLPEATQKEIRKLRDEARTASAKAREQVAAKAREAALAEAATEREAAVAAARAEETARIAKALGLTPAEEAELTPEQVIEKLQQERDAEKTEREKQSQAYQDLLREVAVQDAAAMHDARPDRLTDSRSFMRQVRSLDTTADDFRAQVADLVKAAVEADGDLKAVKKPAPPAASGGTTVAGSKTKDADGMSVDELIAAGFTKRR